MPDKVITFPGSKPVVSVDTLFHPTTVYPSFTFILGNVISHSVFCTSSLYTASILQLNFSLPIAVTPIPCFTNVAVYFFSFFFVIG